MRYTYNVMLIFGLLSTDIFMSMSQDNNINNYIEKISRHVEGLTASTINVPISFKNIVIPNNLISACMKKIELQQSFKPLLETWSIIKQYHKDDEKVLCQFCILLLLDYHCIIHANAHKNKKFMLITLISLYAQLNAIPLAKLFEVLEECLAKYNEIANALAPYEEVPFYIWIQNNWWVPAVLTGFTVISYLKWRRGQASPSNIQKADAL